MYQNQIGNTCLFSKKTIQEYFLLYPLSNESLTFEKFFGENNVIEQLQGNVTVEQFIEKSQLYITGDLICKGTIERSTIVCLGDVTIQGTVSFCTLFVRGKINCISLNQCLVINEMDFIVKNEVRSSEITSGGSFDGIKAIIQGSKLVFCNNIIAGKVTKPGEFIHTSLIAGDKRLLREKILQQKTKLTDFKIKIASTKHTIEHIVKRMIQLKKLTMKVPLLDEMKSTLLKLEKQYQDQIVLVQVLTEQSQKPRVENFIQINSTFTDGIFIEIDGTKFHTTSSSEGIRFKTDGEKIVQLQIKQLL